MYAFALKISMLLNLHKNLELDGEGGGVSGPAHNIPVNAGDGNFMLKLNLS